MALVARQSPPEDYFKYFIVSGGTIWRAAGRGTIAMEQHAGGGVLPHLLRAPPAAPGVLAFGVLPAHVLDDINDVGNWKVR